MPSTQPEPPQLYTEFVGRYPDLARAWEAIADAGRKGPLDDKTARLVKLAVAVGAGREGAVHASVRKAVAMGIQADEIEQVVALAAGTLGLPSAVASYGWIRDIVDGDGG
jgi:4-carboxymuconolactone decarboxylase